MKSQSSNSDGSESSEEDAARSKSPDDEFEDAKGDNIDGKFEEMAIYEAAREGEANARAKAEKNGISPTSNVAITLASSATRTSSGAPPQAVNFKNSLLSFLKHVASATGDLSQITCPSILLNGKSLVEYSAYWCYHPLLLASIAWAPDPFERIIIVVKWFLSTLYGSYASRSSEQGMEKKPFNPILGEQFICHWDDLGMGKTWLVCEQVSHHPPISAFHIENEKSCIQVNGFNGQKTRFTGTAIKVEQVGQVQILLPSFNEEVRISYPELYLRGVLTGSPFVELVGPVRVESTSGASATLEFVPKGWFSGEYHGLKGVIRGPEAAMAKLASERRLNKQTDQMSQHSNTSINSVEMGYSGSASTGSASPPSSTSSASSTSSLASGNSGIQDILYIWGKWIDKVYCSQDNPDVKSRKTSTVPSPASDDDATNSSYALPSPTASGSNLPPSTSIFFDIHSHVPVKPIIRSWKEQGPLETHQIWHEVTDALSAADYSQATMAKSKIEEDQRALRKERASSQFLWRPKYFISLQDAEDDREAELMKQKALERVQRLDLPTEDAGDETDDNANGNGNTKDRCAENNEILIPLSQSAEDVLSDIPSKTSNTGVTSGYSLSRFPFFRRSKTAVGSSETECHSAEPAYSASSTSRRTDTIDRTILSKDSLLTDAYPWIFNTKTEIPIAEKTRQVN